MKRTQILLATLSIVFLGILFNGQRLNQMPSHIHAWAQSDRYALALGFIDNHFNFFKPQVSIYNHQFPDKWMTPSEHRNTAVDFPMHDYIPALLMKLFGTRTPWVFRIYLLLYSFWGLFFLYKVARKVTQQNGMSLFITVFAATSPVFVYYQAGFLPTIPSLSNAIIGIYFYLLYKEFNVRRNFFLSVFFFTMAALSRTTFAIPFIAMAGIEFLSFVKQPRKESWKIVPVASGFALILSYFLFNTWLRKKYGSDFLAAPLPAKTLNDALEFTRESIQRWGLHYFTVAHYVAMAIGTAVATYMLITKRSLLQIRHTTVVFFTALYFIGSILFYILMIRQFPRHDYYFLDVFFLPVILLVAILFRVISATHQKYNWISNWIVWLILTIPMVVLASKKQSERNTPQIWDKNNATVLNYSGSAAFLDSIGISPTQRILVLDAVAPNLPFVLMNRTGYTLLSTNKEATTKALQWDFDFIVFQNEFFYSDIYSNFPEIINHLKPYATNQKISVFTLSETQKNKTLEQFLGFDAQPPIYTDSIIFDKPNSALWANVKTRMNEENEAEGYLASTDEYGLTFKISAPVMLAGTNRYILIDFELTGNVAEDCFIVVALKHNNETIYYKTANLKGTNSGENWDNQSFIFQIPNIPKTAEELACYLWNPGKNELKYKNMHVRLY